MLTDKWKNILTCVDYAFQPIVDPQTAGVVAVEALVRFSGQCSSSIDEFFNTAYNEGMLFYLDIELRNKAVEKFKQIPFFRNLKLFFNYDPRIQNMSTYEFGKTEQILSNHGLSNDMLCLELSEKHLFSHEQLKSLLEKTKQRGFYIALDDFGTGFAGLELFYSSEPDFIKFDRFLISGIDRDIKKKSFCSHLISLSRIMGSVVIAEGVETVGEFNVCLELGFDLVQGYYIQYPTTHIEEITQTITILEEFKARNRREDRESGRFIAKELVLLPAISLNDLMQKLLNLFHENNESQFFPIVDAGGCPIGIISDKSLKQYLLSPYGYDLLKNKHVSQFIDNLLIKCPIADINTGEDKILEILVNNPDSDGIIMTRNLKYAGFLNSRALLNVINEQNLYNAREMNPLSRLPGNRLVQRYINESASRHGLFRFYIHLDMKHFKPFNDRFGFRQGDRAIMIFSDLLKNSFQKNSFIGHIGGDDFFIGKECGWDCTDDVMGSIKNLIENFSSEVSDFYSDEERHDHCYKALSREGEHGIFPLLSAYAAILVSAPRTNINTNELTEKISSELALLKNDAKNNPDMIALSRLE